MNSIFIDSSDHHILLFKKKKKKNPPVRSRILSKVVFASCVRDTPIARITGCVSSLRIYLYLYILHFYLPAYGQAVVTGVVNSPPPRFLPSISIAYRIRQSHCSSIFHRVLLTHALAVSASQFVHKKTSPRIYSNMHSAGLELTKLTFFTRMEDNLIRNRGDRSIRRRLPLQLLQQCTYQDRKKSGVSQTVRGKLQNSFLRGKNSASCGGKCISI